MTASPDLVARVRAALAGRDVREVAMFGGISFMVDDRMLVAARGSGDLLVRIDPDDHAELSGRPGAKPAMMGAGRPMGERWIAVGPEGVAGDALDAWLAVALAHHAATGDED